MKVTLLGFTVSNDEMNALLDCDATMPIQTHAFAWNLVGALHTGGATVQLLSSDPASNYPGNPRIAFRGRRFVAHGVHGRRLGFINILGLKHVTRFVSCLVSGTKELRRWRPEVLMIHGVHSPYLWYGALVRLMSGIKTVVVMTDPPGVVLPPDPLITRALKRLDCILVRGALSHVDGVVALTVRLASDFAPGAPSIIVEGFSPPGPSPSRPAANSRCGARVIYAGGLSPSSGVDRLVSAFRRTSAPDARLYTYGRGQLSEWINDQCSSDSRIARVQFSDRETVLGQYVDADVLVQPRRPSETFAPYSFPSKLMEYMASGTAVLSTRLPGIPDEYEPFLYWIEDDSIEGFTAALERVLSGNREERREKGLAAAEFVRANRSVEAQGLRLYKFLRRVAAARSATRS